MREHGTMDIDFRLRCLVPNGTFDRIYYGHLARGYDGPDADRAQDLPSPYAALGEGPRVRRPGSAVATSKHFFSKRIMTDEERQAGQVREIAARYGPPAVQGGGDARGVGARDGARGANGAEEPAPRAEGSGRGDRSAGEEEMTT